MFNRKKNPKAPHTQSRRSRPWVNILVVASVILSIASVVWTTYSVLDLLSVGIIAVTVAATLDLVWISIQYAQHKGIPLMGSRTATEFAGWVSIAAVVGLLVWHGISLNGQTVAGQVIDKQTSIAIAVASPLLPLGAKFVMMLAVARFADPTALTPEEQDTLNAQRRQEAFEAQQRVIAAEQRKADHVAWLREQDEARAKDRAQAEAERERLRVEHDNEMARLEQERERDAAEAAARLEQQRADAERAKEEARLRAELEIAEITNRNEIEMLRATSGVEIDIQRADLQNDLRRRMPITIQGQVQHELEPTRTYPAASKRISATVNVDSLTPARQAKKQLAALWYAASEADPELTKAQFARQQVPPVSPVEMSRATAMFSREDIAQDQAS